MKIDIVSDVICPWCFIGKRRMERALAARPDLAVTLNWRPFQLNPDMPEGGLDRRTYLALKFGGEPRARQVYRLVQDAAESEGLSLAVDRIGRTPNTVAAHRMIRFAGAHGRQDAVVEALFQAYFMQARDVGRRDSLVEIAAECGLDPDTVRAYLASDADAEAVRREDGLARRMGINGVPCFIVEVFLQVFRVAEEADRETAEPIEAAGV